MMLKIFQKRGRSFGSEALCLPGPRRMRTMAGQITLCAFFILLTQFRSTAQSLELTPSPQKTDCYIEGIAIYNIRWNLVPIIIETNFDNLDSLVNREFPDSTGYFFYGPKAEVYSDELFEQCKDYEAFLNNYKWCRARVYVDCDRLLDVNNSPDYPYKFPLSNDKAPKEKVLILKSKAFYRWNVKSVDFY